MRSFAEIRALPPHELRGLIAGGEPVERVHAAWALGLAIGADVVPAARAQTEREPDAGVRRHLTVVLAGFGEWAVVEALAAADPDPYVRASAVTCLGRGGREASLWRALADPSPVVRETCIQVYGPSWPDARLPELVACASDPALRFATLEALATLRLSEALLAELSEVLTSEPDRATRRAIWAILLRQGRAVALRHAGRRSVHLQIELLQLLDARVPWDELGDLDRSALGRALIRYVVLESVPLEALADSDQTAHVCDALARRPRGELSLPERRALVSLARRHWYLEDWEEWEEWDERGGLREAKLIAALARHGILPE